MTAIDLHAAIAAVCPIDGISVGKVSDKATWSICFAKEATAMQIAAAKEIMDKWDAIMVASPPVPVDLVALQSRIDALEKAVVALGGKL